jgi:hypothetical protein
MYIVHIMNLKINIWTLNFLFKSENWYFNSENYICDAEEIFLKFGKFGPFFSMENLLYKLKSYFLGQNLTKFHQKQKNDDNISQPIQHMFIK